MWVKSSKKQEALDISSRTNQTKSVLNMISRMKISKIYQEEQRLTKYCFLRHFNLPIAQNMSDINTDFYQ